MIRLDLLEVLRKDPNFLIKVRKDKMIINKSQRRYPLILPKTVNIAKELFQGLFLIFGDGHYKSKLNLTNHLYRIHNCVIDSFENKLDIPKEVWRLRILHHKHQNKELMNLVKQYWIRCLNFNETQLYPKISYSEYKTCIQGIGRIQIDKMNIADVIRTILEEVIKLIDNDKLDKKDYCYIFDALLNAEGSVNLNSQGGIHKVNISFNQTERDLFKKVFLKIVPEKILIEKSGRFIIRNWKNIYQFIKSFIKSNVMPFSLRPFDAYNLFSGFLKHKRTKALRNYLETIEKNPNRPLNVIAKLANRDSSSIRCTLLRRCKGYIQTEWWKHKRLATLSSEGRILLKVIRQIEKWLPDLKRMLEYDLQLLNKLEVS